MTRIDPDRLGMTLDCIASRFFMGEKTAEGEKAESPHWIASCQVMKSSYV